MTARERRLPETATGRRCDDTLEEPGVQSARPESSEGGVAAHSGHNGESGVEGVQLMIRVAFGSHGALGPGKMRLLELIDQHGSIAAATRSMGMSYRRAWLLINGLNEAFPEPVVATRRGGPRGGRATLTTLGHRILQRYRTIEQCARAAVHTELAALATDLLPDSLTLPKTNPEINPNQLR